MRYIGVFQHPGDQPNDWTEYYGDGRALYVDADTAEQAAQLMAENSEIESFARDNGDIWRMVEMPDDLDGTPLQIADSGERIRITVMDCVLRGSGREWHSLFLVAGDPESADAIAMPLRLPSNTDTRDAIVGMFLAADDWAIGALASGLYQSDAYHYRYFELQIGFDHTHIVADRSIGKKYTIINI